MLKDKSSDGENHSRLHDRGGKETTQCFPCIRNTTLMPVMLALFDFHDRLRSYKYIKSHMYLIDIQHNK